MAYLVPFICIDRTYFHDSTTILHSINLFSRFVQRLISQQAQSNLHTDRGSQDTMLNSRWIKASVLGQKIHSHPGIFKRNLLYSGHAEVQVFPFLFRCVGIVLHMARTHITLRDKGCVHCWQNVGCGFKQGANGVDMADGLLWGPLASFLPSCYHPCGLPFSTAS